MEFEDIKDIAVFKDNGSNDEEEYEGAVVINPNNALHIPLNFWFSRSTGKSQEEILAEMFKETECIKCYSKIEYFELMFYVSKSSVWELYNDVDYLENRYIQGLSSIILFPRVTYFEYLYDKVAKLIKKYDWQYAAKLYMNKNEIINGYESYIVSDGEYIMRRPEYEKFIELWNNNKQYIFTEFYEIYNEIACSDWSKIDQNGNSYGGFYDYPEGSYEKENAWVLTREANGLALWNLPFPKEVILHTIKFTCKSRRESVRFSNFICEWVKRKMNQLKNGPSLQLLCKINISKHKLQMTEIQKEIFDSI